jgi:hypothetical protein
MAGPINKSGHATPNPPVQWTSLADLVLNMEIGPTLNGAVGVN